MKLFLIFIILFWSTVIESKLLDTSRHVVSRQKRWLIWSDGGVNWVQFIFGLGLPIEVKNQAITIGTVMKAFYTLPTNSSVYTSPNIDYARKKRSTTRWVLYEMLENFLERYNYGDGKACILKSICEISDSPLDEDSGILAEIVTAVLRPSTTNDVFQHQSDMDYFAAEKLGKTMGNCNALFPECSASLVQQFSKFIK